MKWTKIPLSKDYYYTPKINHLPAILIHNSCTKNGANKSDDPHNIRNWVDFSRHWTSRYNNHKKCNLCCQDVPKSVLDKAKFINDSIK